MISLVEWWYILQPAGSLCRNEVTLKHFIACCISQHTKRFT